MATADHLTGAQWGVMNETGSYPGQPWLWLYTLWYQVPGFDNSANVDLIAIYLTGAGHAAPLGGAVPARAPRHPALRAGAPPGLAELEPLAGAAAAGHPRRGRDRPRGRGSAGPGSARLALGPRTGNGTVGSPGADRGQPAIRSRAGGRAAALSAQPNSRRGTVRGPAGVGAGPPVRIVATRCRDR